MMGSVTKRASAVWSSSMYYSTMYYSTLTRLLFSGNSAGFRAAARLFRGPDIGFSMAVMVLLSVAFCPMARAAETVRGALPRGSVAPRTATEWEFSSVPGAPEDEVVAFLYLDQRSDPRTSLIVVPVVMPSAIRALEVYANGELSERFDGAGPVAARKPTGFRPREEILLTLSKGIRPGLNRISLLARYSAEVEDDPGGQRASWTGFARFNPGRLVRLSLLFRGFERVFDVQAALYQALRRFDQELRNGQLEIGRHNLGRELRQVGDMVRSLQHDAAVRMTQDEQDRYYLETWNESGQSKEYLDAQLDLARRIAETWAGAVPLCAAHQVYQYTSRKANLSAALTDVALSKENLRNACAVLATRAGEAAPDAIVSLRTLMGQDLRLMETLTVACRAASDSVASRSLSILKDSPAWRDKFTVGSHALKGFRKAYRNSSPPKAAIERDVSVASQYLGLVESLARRDLIYARLVSELAGCLLEPRFGAASIPRRDW